MTYEEFKRNVVVEPVLTPLDEELTGVTLRFCMSARFEYKFYKYAGLSEEDFIEHAKRTFYEHVYIDAISRPLWRKDEV